MSHYSLLVQIPKGEKNIKNYVSEALAPYDETSPACKKEKWDWYDLGGRWKNLLCTKKGKDTFIAKIKDIDFKKMQEESLISLKTSWEAAESLNDGLRHLIYGIKPGMTKEEYLENLKFFSTYAVLTKDNSWVSPGEMGSFGLEYEKTESKSVWSQKFFERFIQPLDPEDIIVIVDCHI